MSQDEASIDYDALYETDFLGCIDMLAEKSADIADSTRRWISSLPFSTPVAIYWNPQEKLAGYCFGRESSDEEKGLIASLLSERFGLDKVAATPLSDIDADGYWVKIAYSPTLRALGEVLHYYPSRRLPTGGGRPAAALVASTLLGTGLGYGAGTIYEKLMPEWATTPGETRRRFMRNGALLGAGVGAVPGVYNMSVGRSFSDPTLFSHDANEAWQGKEAPSRLAKAARAIIALKQAEVGTLGPVDGPPVQVDELGRVLWGGNVDATTRAMTLGALYGASRIPDSSANPGSVTPHQMGMFGLMAGAAGGGLQGYVAGRAVGAGLGALTALPQSSQDMLARAGVVTGILNSLVPQLYR